MQEYVSMSRNSCQNIMEQIREEDLSRVTHYFLPYHVVLKPDSTTTKLRVVFAGSCTTSFSISLNDVTGWLWVLWPDLDSYSISSAPDRHCSRCSKNASDNKVVLMWSEIAADIVDDKRRQTYRSVPANHHNLFYLHEVTTLHYTQRRCYYKIFALETWSLALKIPKKERLLDDTMALTENTGFTLRKPWKVAAGL